MKSDHGHRSYVPSLSMRGRGSANRFSIEERMEPAEEDSFLWSLADLMTLLLIFFVLLYANTLPQSEFTIQHMEPIAECIDPPLQELSIPHIEPIVEEATIEGQEMKTEAVGAPFSESTEESEAVGAPLSESTAETEAAVAPLSESTAETEAVGAPLSESTEETEAVVASLSESAEETESLDSGLPEKMDGLEENFSGDFYIRWEEKDPVFVLGEKISFNVGKATLLASSRSALTRIIEIIQPMNDYQVIVSGHTDNVAISTPIFPSNWELSAARAASVAKFLSSHGIDPKRLVIQGKSEFHPLMANTSEENRRINRRVEVSLLPIQ